MAQTKRYFLGCLTQSGFTGFFEGVAGRRSPYRATLIKAGPGCGKSSLMRRVGVRLDALGFEVEYIHCGSDPDSLDGLLCPALGEALLDATAPHALEPDAPGALQEVLSLYDCIDGEKLRPEAERIAALLAENAAEMARARRFAGAAANLCDDAERAARALLLRGKLQTYLRGLAARELPRRAGRGREELRLATNLTPDGYIDHRDFNFAGCARRIVFCDRFGAVARAALLHLREAALAAGYDIVSCRDPLAPQDRLTALCVPQLSLCFLWDGAFGELSREGARCVHAARFLDHAALAEARPTLGFTLRAAKELADEAMRRMDAARRAHMRLESCYGAAMDFGLLREREAQLMRRLLRGAKSDAQ